MRHFKDGDELTLEPWRAKAFPLIKDLVVNRRAFDHIIAGRRYVSVSTGQAPEGNDSPSAKRSRTSPWTPPPASAAEPASRRAPTLRLRCSPAPRSPTSGTSPRASRRSERRALGMVAQMNAEGFGNCTSIGECTGVCPKEIPLDVIANMNRDYVCGTVRRRDDLPRPSPQ